MSEQHDATLDESAIKPGEERFVIANEIERCVKGGHHKAYGTSAAQSTLTAGNEWWLTVAKLLRETSVSETALNTPHPAPNAAEPMVPNGEYREIQLGGSAPSARVRSMYDAPKDGTPVLGWVPTYYRGKGAWVVVLWLEEKGMREAGWMDNRAFQTTPTHWMPLPEAPHV